MSAVLWRPRRRRVVVFVLIVLIGMFMASHAGTALVVTSEVQDPEFIVSLASHEWERLPVAARLARRYPAAGVILTQPAIISPLNCHDCPNRAKRLTLLGVEPERIVLIQLPRNGTYEEALAIRAFMQERRSRRVLIVTSPYHTRRALATFRLVMRPAGIDIGLVPSFPESPAVPERWWMSSYDRWYVRYEWAAVLWNRFKHGVPLSAC